MPIFILLITFVNNDINILGSNILVGKDGVPVLTSTPVRLEPTAEEVSEKTEKGN